MYIDVKKIVSAILILVLGAGIGIGIVKIIARYQAPKQTVSVVGTGEVDAETDQATISIQIKSTSTTYEKAQEENKKDVNDLKFALTALGIPESRITTSSYSPPIMRNNPTIDYIDGVEETANKMMPSFRIETTPSVTTTLTLTLDPIKNIEKIFDVVSKNPEAQITNTYYSLKDRKTWESKAKEEALKDARNQIEAAARINHLKVGKLLTLEDANNPRPYPMNGKTLEGISPNDPEFIQSDSSLQAPTMGKNENIYLSEQTVKITSSYNATYELY